MSCSPTAARRCAVGYTNSRTLGIFFGPFVRRDLQGRWQEMDHQHVKCVTFQGCTIPDLVSFLSGRDALLAEEYPYMARLASLGVKVMRKNRKKIYEEKDLEILKNIPKTEDLPLLLAYARHEWLYGMLADKRDRAAGIPIEVWGFRTVLLRSEEVQRRG